VTLYNRTNLKLSTFLGDAVHRGDVPELLLITWQAHRLFCLCNPILNT